MSVGSTSVIVPALNAEATLARTLESILRQEPAPLEVIVVDDGSTDGTELVAHSFQDKVQIICQDHAGPAAARNLGLNTARGEYVAFLDADDYWLPGFLSSCEGCLERHRDAIAVSVGLRFIRMNGSEYAMPNLEPEDVPSGSDFVIGDFFKFWAKYDHIRTGSCLIRSEAVKTAGLQLEHLRIAEDLEYWAYLATFGKWAFVPRVLWVCDSLRAAAQTGWLKKYRLRRELSPTVEEWQERILPRLKPADVPDFRRIRGRVAANFAHSHLLAGQDEIARWIIQQYEDEMPASWSSHLMRWAGKHSRRTWRMAASVIALREQQKALLSSPHQVAARFRSRPRLSLKRDENGLSAAQRPFLEHVSDCSSGVTTIIPAYNSAHCLARAIQSSLAQDPPPMEVIVINDGSTDDTAAVARSFGKQIIYLEQENAGQGAARNAGLQLARGEFVAFLDADDYRLPGFISACTGFLRHCPKAVAVSTGLCFRGRGEENLVLPRMLTEHDNGRLQPWVLHSFFTFWGAHDHVRTGAVMIRRSVIEAAGYQQAHLRISQDLEYWGYIATFGPWGFIPQVYWMCDSERMAQARGWLRKYRKRRQLCPTVEQWQERIVPRLKPEDLPGFKKVRGRVAASFAQNHVLAGRPRVARQTVRAYSDEMPPVWSAHLLRLGDRMGNLTWLMACFVVKCREYQKAWAMGVRKLPSSRKVSSAAPALGEGFGYS